VRLDVDKRLITVDGREAHLMPSEYEVFKQLALSGGRVLTHRVLLSRVWRPRFENEVGEVGAVCGTRRHLVDRPAHTSPQGEYAQQPEDQRSHEHEAEHNDQQPYRETAVLPCLRDGGQWQGSRAELADLHLLSVCSSTAGAAFRPGRLVQIEHVCDAPSNRLEVRPRRCVRARGGTARSGHLPGGGSDRRR
jgi:hypothetical protein